MSWKTTLSAIITTSSTEAELISAAYCAIEVVFLRKLDQELGFVQVSPTIIFEDNNGLLHLAIRVILTPGRSKHLEYQIKPFRLVFACITDS